AASTHEDYKRGSVDGTNVKRAGYPSPSIFDEGPTPVVERRVAPGIIVDPSPTPRIDPRPVAFAIRHPAGRDSWEPDVAILGIGTPVAVIIEVFVAHDITGAVPGRARVVIAAFASVAPAIKIVRWSDLLSFGVERASAGEDGALAGMQGISLSVAGR